MKTIVFFILLMFTCMPCSFSQKKGDMGYVIREIRKKNRHLARELKVLKFIPAREVKMFVELPDTIKFVPAFYVLMTEMSNKEYREFTDNIRDSIAKEKMRGIIQFGSKGERLSEGPVDYDRDDIKKALTGTLLKYDSLSSILRLNTKMLRYSFKLNDSTIEISIYPDTIWHRYDDPARSSPEYKKDYFTNKKYDHYPVVGISFPQMMAFCDWKTRRIRELLPANMEADYSVPTIFETDSAGSEYPSYLLERRENHYVPGILMRSRYVLHLKRKN